MDTDHGFVPLFPHQGRPVEAPGRVALVTVMPFADGLSDRQAADAGRRRMDGKDALGVEWTDPGFDASVLSEFRDRLIAGQAEPVLLEPLRTRVREAGLRKPRGRQRTDATPGLAALQTRNRRECVGATLCRARKTLAVVVPDWLRDHGPADWGERDGRRFEE